MIRVVELLYRVTLKFEMYIVKHEWEHVLT